MSEKITLPISALDLDINNPRFQPAKDQIEATRNLLTVELGGEKVFALALDICEAEMLDPGDRLYVKVSADTPGKYTTLDGNRRLTALRLLSETQWLDREDIGLSLSMRQRFQRLRKKFENKWPTEVDVVVFTDTALAKRFIRLRHTGENAGAGRSAWSALQIARFDETGVWQCLAMLRTEKRLELAVINQLEQSDFSISTFERVAVTAEFQRRFSYAITETSFKLTSDNSPALAALSKLASDVASRRVTTRGEFEEIKTMMPYFDEVEAAITPPSKPQETGAEKPAKNHSSAAGSTTTTTGSANTSSNTDSAGSTNASQQSASASSPAQTTSATASARKPRKSKYLVSKKELLTVTNRKCRAIVDELKERVQVAQGPYACALLLRALLEMTAELYLKAMQAKVTSNNTTNILQAANHLLGNQHKTDPAHRMEIAESFKTSSSVYEELSTTAHNTINEVSEDHVRTSWNNIRDGLDLLWKRIYSAESEAS